jgi:hypothetical protein
MFTILEEIAEIIAVEPNGPFALGVVAMVKPMTGELKCMEVDIPVISAVAMGG